MNLNSAAKKKVGNLILILSTFIIMMLNWNSFSLYEKVNRYNSLIFAFVLIAVLLMYTDLNSLIRDRLFYLVILINIISVAGLFIRNTGKITAFVVFDISLALYLADKIRFSKKELLSLAVLFAAFFFYWTFDVKGYFKGYSINLGGEILITGFMFVIFLMEYLRFRVMSPDKPTEPEPAADNPPDSRSSRVISTLKKYILNHPFVFTLLEMFMALWGYNIISWYRSRTAFFTLIIFFIFMLIPRRFTAKKPVFFAITALTVAGTVIAPVIYLYVGSRINTAFPELFYKPLFSSRFVIWPQLFDVYKSFPVTGIGTLYINDTVYRNGLLDTCNVFLDLLVVHGPFVCAGVFGLLIARLFQCREKMENSHFARMAFCAILGMLVVSYAENYILTVPFTAIFLITFGFINSQKADEERALSDAGYNAVDMDHYKLLLKNGLADKLKVTLPVTAMIAVMYLLLGPLEIYFGNYDDFNITANDFIWFFLAALIMFIITANLILLLFERIAFKLVAWFFFSFGVASYIQYMFLNNELMNVDGELKGADEVGGYAGMTIAIWAAIYVIILVVILVLKDKWRIPVMAGSAFLCAIMLVASISLPFMNLGRTRNNLWLSGENQMNIAKGDNIIILEPDTLCRGYLQRILETYPDATDAFKDFTYYDHSDSVYWGTYRSIIHMLTGEPFDDSITRYEWTKKALSNDRSAEFFKLLHEKDYTVNIYSKDIMFEEFALDKFDNIVDSKIHVKHGYLFTNLLKMSIYRYVPYALKSTFDTGGAFNMGHIYMYEGTTPEWENSKFNARLNENGLRIEDSMENGFLLNHFAGAHQPFINDENAMPVGEGSVPKAATLRGVLKVMETYMENLKEIGKYDDSTIIILGDHGIGTETDAVLFVKHKNETHDKMQISDREVNYDDFIPTVVDIIGGDHTEFGDRLWK